MGFLSKSIPFFQRCKNFENRLRFDKATESLNVGTFLRQSVESLSLYGYMVALLVGHWTCHLQIADLSPGWALLRSDLG